MCDKGTRQQTRHDNRIILVNYSGDSQSVCVLQTTPQMPKISNEYHAYETMDDAVIGS